MNRAQRRAARKATPACMRATKEQKISALLKNGITMEDLEAEFHKGYKAGFNDAAPATFKTIFAATCLALHDLYGFGPERCAKVLQAVDGHVLTTLDSEEIIDDVWKRVGLRIDFKEPFDRVESAGRRTWAKQ